MSKVPQERGSGSLPSSTETNPRDHVKSILTGQEAETPSIRRLVKLAPTKLIVELADGTVKRPKGIVENVLVGIDKIVFPVDFIVLDMSMDIKVPLILERPYLSTSHARLMGEALILNRSQDPEFGDFLKLNDLNEPLELRRNQKVNDLGLTIKEGEVIDKLIANVVKTRHVNGMIKGLDEYPIMENIDAYRDKDMGDVIVTMPFYKVSCVEARRFDGLITIYDGNDNVTYQMARLHPWFKHLTNAQCNKIRPLLKVSARDKLEELLEYMNVYDNDASESSQPSWGKSCTLMLLGMLVWGKLNQKRSPKGSIERKLFKKTCSWIRVEVNLTMNTTMVPKQVKTMKIQAGVQVSKPRKLRRTSQILEVPWKLYLL
ncbi:hypothetical protein Tco_0331277 [Tanacetum coccineum]